MTNSKYRPRKPSSGYLKILDEINGDPDLISVLYDLKLLPELVDDDLRRSTRQEMITFVVAYRLGQKTPPSCG